MDPKSVHAYRGWKSTKLHLALIVMALATLVFALMRFPVEAFGNYCLLLAGALSAFSGSSAAERFAPVPTAPVVSGVAPGIGGIG